MNDAVSALAAKMMALVGAPDAPTPAQYVTAAESLLAPLLAKGGLTRPHAVDLLVADALVTAAFEHAGDDPTRVDACAAWAMRRMAALGVA